MILSGEEVTGLVRNAPYLPVPIGRNNGVVLARPEQHACADDEQERQRDAHVSSGQHVAPARPHLGLSSGGLRRNVGNAQSNRLVITYVHASGPNGRKSLLRGLVRIV